MSVNPQDFQFLAELLRRETANVLAAGKEYLLESRLEPVARTVGLQSVGDVVARLRSGDAQLQQKVLEAMMTGETLFFRDIYPFDALANELLPRFMAKRKNERSLSIWCAACSYGQEPYSIAMLIHDKFPELLGWNFKLLATDISEASLARAKEAQYSKFEVERGLPPAYKKAYFTEEGPCLRLNPAIRKLVSFSPLNLIGNWPGLPPFDFVFMRNVLIYFDVAQKRSVLQQVRRVMRPHGVLFLGGGETTLNIDDRFQREQSGRATYYTLRETT